MTVAEFVNLIGFKVKDNDVKKVNNTISGIKSTATKLLGTLGIGFSLTQLNSIAEEFDGIGDRIAYAAGDAENLDEIMNKVLNSANESRTSMGQFADEVTNLKQANENVFPLEDATTFVEYVNKLGKAAGYSDSEISSMQSSIQRIVASGEMAASDLNRIGRQTPALITTICDGLGVTREELDSMASSGQLSAETIKTAMMNSTDKIDESFSKLNFGVGDALLNIRNKWGFWVDETNKMFGITNGLGNTMVKVFNSLMNALNKVRNGVVWLSEKLGGAENLFKLLSIAIGSAFGAVAVLKIMKFITALKAMDKAAIISKLKILAIFAVIVILALIVEDFIAFMKGEDSLFGTLLEKAGVDTEALRENIKNAFEFIQEKIGGFFDWLKNNENAQEVLKAIAVAIGIVTAAVVAWKVVAAIATVVTTAFGIAMQVLTSPITLVILAIVALIAIIYLLIKNWDKIKEAAAACWDWICGIWAKVADWFNNNVIQPLIQFFQELWDGIVAIFSGVVEWFMGIFSAAWEGIKNIFSEVGSFFQGVWDTITNIFVSIGQTIADGVSGAFRATVNAVIGFAESIINGFIANVNNAISLINKIPGVNIPIISAVSIPKLAEGGYVEANKPQYAIIGDNKHEGEIVSPVSKMKEAMYDVMRMFSSTLRPMQATQALVQPERSYVITQNIEFNNEFNGDTAIQRSASSAMDKSANDVTAQLARGLAYAR